MNKEWKEFKKKILNNNFLLITAENPDGEPKDKIFNQKQNLSLEKDLKEFEFIKVIGWYKNNKENSFLVFGIDLESTEKLREKYNQKSVTFSDGEDIYRIYKDSKEKLKDIKFYNKKPEKDFYTEIKIGGEIKYFVAN